jgi:hypothetical protein
VSHAWGFHLAAPVSHTPCTHRFCMPFPALQRLLCIKCPPLIDRRAKAPEPRPEGPTDLSPGFTLGSHPYLGRGLKGRRKAPLAGSAAPSGLDRGEASFPRVNPGLRSLGPLGRKTVFAPPPAWNFNSQQALKCRATLRLPLRGKSNLETVTPALLPVIVGNGFRKTYIMLFAPLPC